MKRIKFLVMAFAAILCVNSFVACGDDDDSTDQTTKNVGVPIVTYQFAMSTDAAKFIDATVTYYDANGQQQTETISGTDPTFNLEFTPTKSQKVGITSTYTVKSNINELIAQEVKTYETALAADPSTKEPSYNLAKPALNSRLGVYIAESKSWGQLIGDLGTSLGTISFRVTQLEKYFSKFSWSADSSYSGTYDASTNRFTIEQ